MVALSSALCVWASVMDRCAQRGFDLGQPGLQLGRRLGCPTFARGEHVVHVGDPVFGFGQAALGLGQIITRRGEDRIALLEQQAHRRPIELFGVHPTTDRGGMT
jgi:hypothetical protein